MIISIFFGGVLFYLSPQELDTLLLKSSLCKNILILDEDADKDIETEEKNIMFDFSERIAKLSDKKQDEIVKFKVN